MATIIAIGTVKQVMPARWTTPNGQRPPNPHAASNRETIFRPVLFDVEQYLKGQQPQDRLLIFAYGGQVGQDSVRLENDDTFEFREGEQAILFLVNHGRSLNGSLMWDINAHYTITQDGKATNSYHTLPLQQLLNEIQAALKP